MRTNAIVRIILFSLAIVALLTILTVGIAAYNYFFRFDHDPAGVTTSSGSVDADTVRNLSIEWAAGTITIRPADVDQIIFTETEDPEADPMVWVTSGDTLKIVSSKEDNYFRTGSIPSKDLVIEVPRNWICGELEIETAAANVNVEMLSLEKVDFDGASGTFDFLDCSVDAMEIDTVSGDIRFSGTLNTLDCDAASADCEIILHNHPSRIEMDTASGDLDLTLPEDCGFTATLEALSGHLTTDFEITSIANGITSGNGSSRIDISAMSGDVYIRKSTEARNRDH